MKFALQQPELDDHSNASRTSTNTGPTGFEPVYGLPRPALEEWLQRHPAMRERYAADLAWRAKRPRTHGRRAFHASGP